MTYHFTKEIKKATLLNCDTNTLKIKMLHFQKNHLSGKIVIAEKNTHFHYKCYCITHKGKRKPYSSIVTLTPQKLKYCRIKGAT